MNKVTLLNKEFHLGIGFLNEFIDNTGIKLQEFDSVDPTVLMPKLMFHSLSYSYKRSQKNIDFTQDDIFDWIDENGGIGGKFWKDFENALMASMYKDVPVDNSKKKVNQTK